MPSRSLIVTAQCPACGALETIDIGLRTGSRYGHWRIHNNTVYHQTCRCACRLFFNNPLPSLLRQV